jgi:glycine dehydrogenase subunit 1
VNFDDTGKKLSKFESMLLEKGIQMGASLTESIPELGETAVFSVTETHSKEDIDRLCASVSEVLEA